jgi:DNA polymerase kappa
MAMNPESRPVGREKTNNEHDTLKYSLLGPSLTKSGQDNVDQTKV